jgi:hypothetical protein
MLPNVLVIGAQRCGTTTVWHALDRHPDVFMAPAREIRFFSHDHLFNRGAAFYETRFFHGWNGETACGEKTPEYLLMPKVASRIHDVLGGAVKLVVLVRDPAERAHSGYRHSLMLGFESLPFHEALAAEPERIARNPAALGRFGYLARGYYARQLARYIDLFPPENLLIVFYEDLVADQAALFERIFRFIGVAPLPYAERVYEGRLRIEKIATDAGSRVIVDKGNVIRQPSPSLMTFVAAYNDAVDRLRPLSRDEAVAINRNYFRDDILVLSQLTGRDLGAWLGELA